MNRRKFISSAALGAAAFSIMPRHVLGGPGFIAPSDRINLGYIGVGKQVGTLLNGLMGQPETMVLAAADVDSSKLNRFLTKPIKRMPRNRGIRCKGIRIIGNCWNAKISMRWWWLRLTIGMPYM